MCAHTHTPSHTHRHTNTKDADRNGVGSLVSPPAALSYAVRANRTHTGDSQIVFMSELHSDITDTHMPRTHQGAHLLPSAPPSRHTCRVQVPETIKTVTMETETGTGAFCSPEGSEWTRINLE